MYNSQKLFSEAEKLFLALAEHQRREARYAYRAGKTLIQIKQNERRGNWTKWKDDAKFASPRKIEMYMRIAQFLESEDEAAEFGSVTVVDKIAGARKKARKQLERG